MNKELEQLNQTFANLDKTFKELRAEMPMDENHKKMNDMMDTVYSMVNNLHDRIDYSNKARWDWQDSHTSQSSHLPKLTASQMEDLLDSCGAGRDFEIKKPIIWASAKYNSVANKDGVVIELQVDKQNK